MTNGRFDWRSRIDFSEKVRLFSQMQGDNPHIMAWFLQLLKYHMIVQILSFVAILCSYGLFDLRLSYSLADMIPRLYEGKSLIIKNSSLENYELYGYLYFSCLLYLAIFLVLYVSPFLFFNVRLRVNKYEFWPIVKAIFLILFLVNHFMLLYFAPVRVQDTWGSLNAVYRAEFSRGVLLPVFSAPILLFLPFLLSVLPFFIFTRRSTAKERQRQR